MDVWRYSLKDNKWSIVGGSSLGGQPANSYIQSLGTETPANIPAVRSLSSGVYNPITGLFYFFGGGSGPNIYNDVWAWNNSTRKFKCDFASKPYAGSVYGTKGVYSMTNNPNFIKAGVAFLDGNQTFYVFGGIYPSTFIFH